MANDLDGALPAPMKGGISNVDIKGAIYRLAANMHMQDLPFSPSNITASIDGAFNGSMVNW